MIARASHLTSRMNGAAIRPILVAMVAAVLTVAGACAPRTVSTVPDAADDTALDARLLRMLDTRTVDTALIDEVLRSPRSDQRARGALAIGQVKMRARYAVLRRLLIDADTAVAANAAFALGIGKDSGGVTALARAVAGASGVIAREAAWSLGEIGEPARQVIVIALGEGLSQPLINSTAAQRAPAERAALVLSAVKLRPVPVAVVAPWLTDNADDVAAAAAYVIGRPRIPAGARALLAVRDHRDAEVRQYVARGLARSAVGDSLSVMARDALTKLAADADPRVRINAVSSLTTFGPLTLRDVERALGDSVANVRVAAAEGAAAVLMRDTLAWRRAWDRDTTFRVRQLLLTAARTAGVSTLVNDETAWSTDRDARRRMAAMEARAAEPRVDRVVVARSFLRDADARVRATAVSMIPATAVDADVRTALASVVTDAALPVRIAVLNALARRARAEDLELALSLWPLAVSANDADARTASLRLIASAWARDSGNVNATWRARLSALTGDAPASERRLVTAVTPMAAWARVAAAPVPPRPLADYQRLARRWLTPGARQPQAVISTERGQITLELFGADAPLIVEAFVDLANRGFYRNTTFHRVVPNFVVQDGDPTGTGSGGPGFALRESYSRRRHERGAVGLATSGPDTGGSQYYLCHSAQPHLDGGYSVFGRVTAGLDVMDRIVQGDRMLRIEIR